MKLSEHFTMDEFIQSDVARKQWIDNTPTYEAAANLALLATHVLEPARKEYGKCITISSGYRCTKLNRAVGGVATSQHTKGQAADLVCADLRTLYAIIKRQGNFDQVLFESNGKTQWIHVSYNPDGCRHIYNDNYKA